MDSSLAPGLSRAEDDIYLQDVSCFGPGSLSAFTDPTSS